MFRCNQKKVLDLPQSFFVWFVRGRVLYQREVDGSLPKRESLKKSDYLLLELLLIRPT